MTNNTNNAIKPLIESEVLKKLDPSIKKAVDLIKKYIDDKHPILIRHHSDADGFSAGFALEKAILPLIYEAHARERDAWYVYSRKANLTPYYDYSDANRDLSFFMSDKGKYEYKKPLIIICDNGSSMQDLLAIKKMKIYDVKIIVIDHHPVSKEVEDAVDVIVNPHLVGSTYDYSAGMICAEIANLINPNLSNLSLIAAVSGFADRVKSKEYNSYFELAKSEGYSEEFIASLAEVLDFEASTIAHMDSRQILEDLFGKDIKKQKKIIDLLNEELERKKSEAFLSVKKYSHISRTEKLNIVIIPIDTIGNRGDFPSSGKVVGMMHDFVAKSESKPTVSLGIGASMITFRATADTSIDVNYIISLLKHKFPYAQINGGGHAKAGSIKFIPAAYEEIREFVLQEVRR